ncbi:MAG TPA: acyltransferase, partial [Nitrospirota bacterium]
HTFALSGIYSGRFWDIFDFLFKGSDIGIDIFFITSGFLIIRSRLTSPNVIIYLKNRFLRIAPAFTVSVLFCILIIGPLASNLSISDYLHNFLSSRHLPAAFQTNHIPNMLNGSLWTLKVEFIAYLLIAVLCFMDVSRIGPAIIILLVLLLSVDLVYFERPDVAQVKVWSINLNQSTGCLIYFLAGSLFYLYRETVPMDKYFFMATLLLVFILQRTAYWHSAGYPFLTYSVLYFAYSKIPLNNFGRYGDFSYGMYIFAFPVQQTILYYWPNRLTNSSFFAIAFSMTLVIALLSWHLIEKPSLKMK